MVRGVEQLQKELRDDDAVLAGCHTAVDAVGAVRGIRVDRKTVSRPFAIASGDGREPLAKRVGRARPGRAPEALPRVGGAAAESRPSAQDRPPQWPIGSGGLPPSSDGEARRTRWRFSGTKPHGLKSQRVRLRSGRDDGWVNARRKPRPAADGKAEGAALMRVPGASSADPHWGWL